MTRNEQNYYNDVSSIEKSLKRIASALENNPLQEQTVNRAVNRILEGNIDSQVDETLQAEEDEQARLYTDDIKAQDDALNKETQEELDTHHDLLHQLVQNLDSTDYLEFCNEHCLRASDTVEVSNYITDLDYDEVLGIIRELEEKSDDQANEDVIEESFTDTSKKDGVPCDDDYDIRASAEIYNAEINYPHGHLGTKKDCILDYVTNEFGSHGARYTDIIKFAYYLSDPNSPKFGYDNRGYYSQGMSGRRPYLVYGGKDHFVKGINKDGVERYFALSFVESVTDYWKYCDNRKK